MKLLAIPLSDQKTVAKWLVNEGHEVFDRLEVFFVFFVCFVVKCL
jgi:hypothetical protein